MRKPLFIVVCLLLLSFPPVYAGLMVLMGGGSALEINDDFSSDNISPLDNTTNGNCVEPTVAGGVAVEGDGFVLSFGVHDTVLSSANHYAEADIFIDASVGSDVRAGLMLRVNPAAGTAALIIIRVDEDQVLGAWVDGDCVKNNNFVVWDTCDMTPGQTYQLHAEVDSDDLFTCWVDCDGDDELDGGEACSVNSGNADDNTYTGTSIGLYFDNADNVEASTADDLTASAL